MVVLAAGVSYRFIIVVVVFFTLLLSTTGFISGTKSIYCVTPEQVTPINRFFFIILFCFIRSAMMSAKPSLVILEAVVLVMKSDIE